MNIGNFIGNLLTVGFILATMGTLSEVANSFKKEAVRGHREMISIGSLNRQLIKGR